jgi:hypothetical protein
MVPLLLYKILGISNGVRVVVQALCSGNGAVAAVHNPVAAV